MTPFAVFFLRQFFLGISREVEEAAKIDGASHSRIFFRLIVPMSIAPITTLAILTFIGAWNEYLWPLLIARDDTAQPLTLALGIFRSQTPGGSPDWPGLMAMTLLAALPDHHPVRHLRPSGRELHPVLRHQVIPVARTFRTARPRPPRSPDRIPPAARPAPQGRMTRPGRKAQERNAPQ